MKSNSSNASEFEPGYTPVVEMGGPDARVRIGARDGSSRVEWEDDRALEFDAEGRLIVAQVEGRSWRRTLDLRLTGSEIRGEGTNRRLRRLAPIDESLDQLATWHGWVKHLRAEVQSTGAPSRCLRGGSGSFERSEARVEWLLARLERPASWNLARLEAERETVQRLYHPIPVLPPDQYQALVLQATEGCPWDRCSFCTFYRGVPHRIRTCDEFRSHLDAVLTHLGRSRERYRRVFLGQANALLAPTEVLKGMLEDIQRRLPLVRARGESGIDGVYSFLDGFHRPKSSEEFVELRTRGLKRVYLGLESGSEPLLAQLGKPARNEDVVELARRLHAAEVGMGVIVLVGAGGRSAEEEHVGATAALIEQLELRRGDQVYLSPLVPQESTSTGEQARKHGHEALDAVGMQRQEERLRETLRRKLDRRVPLALYDIERLADASPRA